MSTSKQLTTTTTTTILWILVSHIHGLTVNGEMFNGHPEHATGTVQQQLHNIHAPQQQQHQLMADEPLVPAKRSWQNLQGSWGKRAQDHVDSSSTNTQDYIDDIQSLYEQQHGYGGTADAMDFERNLLASMYLDDIVDGQQTTAKRAWKSMNNGGWGKRIGGK